MEKAKGSTSSQMSKTPTEIRNSAKASGVQPKTALQPPAFNFETILDLSR
jgi:hypothetical protein